MFASNPDVAFGDINLSKQSIRGNANPGAGGWPTIRYYNKKTGYEGESYTKKTDKSMCDELGDIKFMKEYIMEAGETSLCSVVTKAGCSERESAFIDKMQAQDPAAIAAQLARLDKMTSKPMKEHLKQWLTQRIAVLKQFAGQDTAHSEL